MAGAPPIPPCSCGAAYCNILQLESYTKPPSWATPRKRAAHIRTPRDFSPPLTTAVFPAVSSSNPRYPRGHRGLLPRKTSSRAWSRKNHEKPPHRQSGLCVSHRFVSPWTKAAAFTNSGLHSPLDFFGDRPRHPYDRRFCHVHPRAAHIQPRLTRPTSPILKFIEV